MSSEEQPRIEGFHRLMYHGIKVDGQYSFSGCYISNDRNFIIVPDNAKTSPDGFQLLPISPEAGKLFYKYINKMCGSLHDVINYYTRHFKAELV